MSGSFFQDTINQYFEDVPLIFYSVIFALFLKFCILLVRTIKGDQNVTGVISSSFSLTKPAKKFVSDVQKQQNKYEELASAFVCNELFASSLTELCGQNNSVDIDDLVDAPPIDVPQQEQSLSNDDYYIGLDIFLEYPRLTPENAVSDSLYTMKFLENVHWQKGGILGRGSFGKVYLGLNIEDGNLFAVKSIELRNQDEANTNEEVQTAIQELLFLRSLKHENIVTYLGSNIENNTINIFLEYVPGGSIATIIQKFGVIKEKLAKKYAQQILAGLDYLHSRQIIHRDIKGANILLDNKGVIKLSDFGAATTLKRMIANGEDFLKGTIFWMAPEVILQNGFGRQADIWSFGCTMIEMITGHPPWKDMFENQISALFNIAISNEVPQIPILPVLNSPLDSFSPLESLSSQARHFIQSCLRREPSERLNSKRLLQHEFLKERDKEKKDSGRKGERERVPAESERGQSRSKLVMK